MPDIARESFSREDPTLSENAEFNIIEFRHVTSSDQLGELVPGVLLSASSAFGDNLEPEAVADHRAHMVGDRVFVAERVAGGGAVSGYSSVSVTSPQEEFHDPQLADQAGVYFSALAIHRDAQGRGLSHEFYRRGFEFGRDQGHDFFFTRTQNPRVENGLIHSVERLVQAKLISDFIVARVIQKGVYGNMLTAERPVARGLSYADIDHDRGDAAIITLQLQL